MQHQPQSGLLVAFADGVKPHRGGLFIAVDEPRLFFLIFGRAAPAILSRLEVRLNVGILAHARLVKPRRRKAKRNGTFCVLPYKQATPDMVCEPAIQANLIHVSQKCG